MKLAVSNQVVARNSLGRFIAACEDAAHETVKEAVERGARLSREMAPTGTKVDARTVPLKSSIFPRMLSRTRGIWYSIARHALPQETGAVPHAITGSPYLSFFWEREGRDWIPAEIYYRTPGLVDIVNHPGHGPQPFLRPAYEIVMGSVMEIARRKYPG